MLEHVDVLMPAATRVTESHLMLWGLIVLLGVLLFGLVWLRHRHQRAPMRVLVQRLLAGDDPRAVAHAMADAVQTGDLTLDTSLIQQLDQLRFQTQPPQRDELLMLLAQVQEARV